MCFVQFFSLKSLNSLLVNDGPLPVTIMNGSPCVGNDCLKHCVKIAVFILSLA